MGSNSRQLPIIYDRYPYFKNVFASNSSILKSEDSEIFEALLMIHSFHDRLRFFKGGIPSLCKAFFGNNDKDKIRKSLAYLIFDDEKIVKRMADLIFLPEYKLNEFGKANVQELLGLCNNEEYPPINGRTTKILRFFGFDVRQLS
ncbi:MAG: hypothetical protein M1269_09565 [Chloroflexi bacterium]|nr:hypothetical protein [Chloroflexota bacterium]